MARQARRRSTAGIALFAALGIWVASAGAATPPTAHAAHAISISEHVDLHLVEKSGSILSERGSATGTFSGAVTARFNVSNLLRSTGTVTFHSRPGTLTLAVVGTPQSLSTFTGSVSVKSGTGRYKHAHGKGRAPAPSTAGPGTSR
jgi:hypothetical protein